MVRFQRSLLQILAAGVLVAAAARAKDLAASPLPNDALTLSGTAPLTKPVTDGIREEQRQQLIQFYLKRIAATPAKRDAAWRPDFSSLKNYQTSIQGHRESLRKMLGLVETKPGAPQVRVLQEKESLRIEEVTIPIEQAWQAQALLFLPRGKKPSGAVVAIPSEIETPEQFAGIAEGKSPSPWLAGLLARNIAVAIPSMTERRDDHPLCKKAGGQDKRRILWRAGFIVGRTLVGIEVQQVIALREFLASQQGIDPRRIAVLGRGQGGMTALYAGAVDDGWAAVASIDYFQQREESWKEPVDRVIYGQLNEFGDAELAALVAPRPLVIANTSGGEVQAASVGAELGRAKRFYAGLKVPGKIKDLGPAGGTFDAAAIEMASLVGGSKESRNAELELRIPAVQGTETQNKTFETLFEYLRGLDMASAKVRDGYWQLNSTPPEARGQKVQQIRKELRELVGTLPIDPMPLRPRTVLIGETDKFLAYDVMLDVAEGVEAYGQLLIPRGVAGRVSERRPAVICQHGFDGSPKYVTGMGKDLESNDHFYHRYGQRLAERGYVVFAPYLTVPMDSHQPHYVYRADLVNPLVRMTAGLGVMRTSIEVTKLHRIVDFLQSLSFVQPDRIGYYGLSYGGYSATWMTPLEPRLNLTIISAHFNDWQTMLTDQERLGASYWTLPDEDFYNWNELNRFDHTQLIAAMWPRPVCVEYGIDDQVTTPEWHARAWNKVKEYAKSWGIEDQIIDDKFDGPHAIHGIGTFSFLDRWLRPERAAGRDYGCRGEDYCYQSTGPDFKGYVATPSNFVPYATQLLDSGKDSAVRGTFYLPDSEKFLAGIKVKLARNGTPGAFVVKFGSSPGAADVGEASISPDDVYPEKDLWYEARLKQPIRLEPAKTYYFEVTAKSGQAPKDCYTVFGPKPFDGKDYPPNFGLSFKIQTSSHE